MELSFYIFFLPLTLISLVIMAVAVVYFLMGLYMLRVGFSENNGTKTSAGSMTILVSVSVLVAAAWFYMEYIWWW